MFPGQNAVINSHSPRSLFTSIHYQDTIAPVVSENDKYLMEDGSTEPGLSKPRLARVPHLTARQPKPLLPVTQARWAVGGQVSILSE